MNFPVKLCTIKGNLVFMNTFYPKVAVASICTALGLALGVSPEVKAASFTLEPTITFEVIDYSERVVDDGYYVYEYDGVGDYARVNDYFWVVVVREAQVGRFAEFNMNSFSLLPNKVIRSVLFETQISSFEFYTGSPDKPDSLSIFGYVGNGREDISDFEAGVFLSSVDISSSSPGDILSFDVTRFVNQRVTNADAFTGFALRVPNGSVYLGGDSFPGTPLRMVVETADVAEPVPEPTTIIGSAIGLCLGGWLKRKKSSQQNKTLPQP